MFLLGRERLLLLRDTLIGLFRLEERPGYVTARQRLTGIVGERGPEVRGRKIQKVSRAYEDVLAGRDSFLAGNGQ